MNSLDGFSEEQLKRLAVAADDELNKRGIEPKFGDMNDAEFYRYTINLRQEQSRKERLKASIKAQEPVEDE